MLFYRSLVLSLICVVSIFSMTACSGSAESSGGVASIEKSQAPDTSNKVSSEINLPTSQSVQPPNRNDDEDSNTNTRSSSENVVVDEDLTDEEITTKFAGCMRDEGFNIPDPELNADGTVDFSAMRQSIFQDPKFNPENRRTSTALQSCLPLLQNATFARSRQPENDVELQDTLLEFAQCIRDKGYDIPDPDFSNGPRAAMGSLFQDIRRDEDLQESIRTCADEFMSGRGPRGAGSPGGGPRR